MYGKVCGEKIKKAVKKTGLTQEKFAKKIKTGRAMISQWIIGNRNPSLKSLEKIAIATKKPLSFFVENSPDYIDTKNIIPLNSDTTIKLPILSTVQCGKPDFCHLDENVIEDFAEIPKSLFPDGNFVVKCQGSSMLPDIAPSAFCIIKKMDTPLNNKDMLIQTSFGYTIKRVKVIKGKVEFYYLNPEGKKLEIEGEVKIIGKVIGSYQKH